MLKLDFDQIRELIEYLNAHEGYRLEDLQSTIYQMLSEFIEVYQYLIPAFATQFVKQIASTLQRKDRQQAVLIGKTVLFRCI